MSQPTTEMVPATPGDVVVASPSAPDYEALRREYEEHEHMSAVLQQMVLLNEQVSIISLKHFPTGVSLTLECDPEIADAYFVVNVRCPDTVDAIRAAQNAWIDEIWSELRQLTRFYRLRMIPHEAG